GHSEYIWSLACLKTGGNIISAWDDGSIRQWKRDGEPVGKPWYGDGGWIGAMAVSPDETMVVCGNADGRLRLWNIKEGSMIGEPWEGHDVGVMCLDWSPKEIASGSEDGTIRRWNPDTEPTNSTTDRDRSFGSGHDDTVTSLCWSKDGVYIFSGSLDGTIRKWRSIDGKKLVVLRGHTNNVRSLCLTPNERYIVSASDDYSVRIWDLKTNQAVGDPLLHDDQVPVVAMSPDGTFIVNAGLDQKIYVWSLEAALERYQVGVLVLWCFHILV
ncbi:WD40 repeat-like protein, partial [Suillus brevipes Sb2]